MKWPADVPLEARTTTPKFLGVVFGGFTLLSCIEGARLGGITSGVILDTLLMEAFFWCWRKGRWQ